MRRALLLEHIRGCKALEHDNPDNSGESRCSRASAAQLPITATDLCQNEIATGGRVSPCTFLKLTRRGAGATSTFSWTCEPPDPFPVDWTGAEGCSRGSAFANL